MSESKKEPGPSIWTHLYDYPNEYNTSKYLASD